MSRIRSGDVRVVGLSELNRALKAIGPDAQKELKAANKKVATFVAEDARAAAYSLGGVAAKVAPSVRASAGTTGAGVTFGGAAYPFAGGAEFGALKYSQFQPWRGNSSDAGYFVYPAIRADIDRIETEWTDAVDGVLRRHGFL